MEKQVTDIQGLTEEAAAFLATLAPLETGATLVTLSGELGAGKTAFTKALAVHLGINDSVTSPTFVLEKIYELAPGTSRGFTRLVHIDAYRLKGGSELAPLGFDELMKDTTNLVMLEWPEQVMDQLPQPNVRISIVANDDGSRTLTYA